jgi:hypothetical protein
MSKRGLALIALFAISTVVVVAVSAFGWMLGDSDQACAQVPPRKSTQAIGNTALRIISPKYGSEVTAIYALIMTVQISDFEPKGILKMAAWIDGKPVEASFSGNTVMLSQVAVAKLPVSMEDSVHNICLAAIDSSTGMEVGSRAGARVRWQWRGPDQVDFGWIWGCCIGALLLFVAAVYVVSAPRAKNRTSSGE